MPQPGGERAALRDSLPAGARPRRSSRGPALGLERHPLGLRRAWPCPMRRRLGLDMAARQAMVQRGHGASALGFVTARGAAPPGAQLRRDTQRPRPLLTPRWPVSSRRARLAAAARGGASRRGTGRGARVAACRGARHETAPAAPDGEVLHGRVRPSPRPHAASRPRTTALSRPPTARRSGAHGPTWRHAQGAPLAAAAVGTAWLLAAAAVGKLGVRVWKP